MINAFKNKLSHGVVGIFSKTEDPAFIEVMGYSGVDFAIIDLEHGPNTIRSAQNLIRAAEISGLFPIIRTAEGQFPMISAALDIGALGVQIPQISTKEDALRAVQAAKFSPAGERGVCRFVRAAKYSSKDRKDYFADANECLVILQIEGLEGIQNLDAIVEVEGIDVIFIGPYDLSASVGVVGDIDNPLVEEKMLEIIQKCKEKNIIVGTFTDTIQNARKWRDCGVQYIAHSVDVGLFHEALKNLMSDIKTK